MNQEEKTYVKSLYYGEREPASYASVKTLHKRIKNEGRYNIKLKDLVSFLKGEEVYTSHLAKKRLKHYAKVIAPTTNYSLEVDSALMPFGRRNRMKYAIVGVDVFSLKTAVRAVTSLKAVEVNRALNAIITELGGHFSLLRSDRGEYYNKIVDDNLRRRNIKHVPAFEPIKTAYAENMIRILKRKL